MSASDFDDIPDFLRRTDTRTHEQRRADVARIKPTLWHSDSEQSREAKAYGVPAHWLDDPGTRALIERREQQDIIDQNAERMRLEALPDNLSRPKQTKRAARPGGRKARKIRRSST